MFKVKSLHENMVRCHSVNSPFFQFAILSTTKKGTMALSTTTFSITILSIMSFKVTRSISDSQHNDTKHNNVLLLCWVSHFIYCYAECGILFTVMLSVAFIYYYAECRYAECHYADYLIFYYYSECRYAECRYAECRYPECRSALKRT